MANKTYSTSQVARILSVHPHTVRLYAALRLIAAPARKPDGYRVFTDLHLAQMRLACAALRVPVLQGGLRKLAIRIIHASAACDVAGAQALTAEYGARLEAERENAVQAAGITRALLGDCTATEGGVLLRRGEAAALLGLSVDQLRGWEMNGLLTVKRRANGYRVYSAEDVKRLRMIRALRCASYSLSAILRLLGTLERDPAADAGRVLDTPDPHEDVVTVCDRLLTSLGQAQVCAGEIRLRLSQIENFMKDNPPL